MDTLKTHEELIQSLESIQKHILDIGAIVGKLEVENAMLKGALEATRDKLKKLENEK